jgi:hypothetical protein
MRWIRRSDQRILRLASVGFHNGQPERGANRSVNFLDGLISFASWRRHSVYGDHEVRPNGYRLWLLQILP